MTSPFGKPATQENEWNIDLSQVESSFALPDDEYLAKCVGLEKQVSKAGNDMYVFTFTIMEGEYQGRDFKLFCALTPQALFKLMEVAEAMQFDDIGASTQFSPDRVINKAVTLVMAQDEYNGKVNSKINQVLAHPKGADAYKKLGRR